jgi:hypothetical protein
MNASDYWLPIRRLVNRLLRHVGDGTLRKRTVAVASPDRDRVEVNFSAATTDSFPSPENRSNGLDAGRTESVTSEPAITPSDLGSAIRVLRQRQDWQVEWNRG